MKKDDVEGQKQRVNIKICYKRENTFLCSNTHELHELLFFIHIQTKQ